MLRTAGWVVIGILLGAAADGLALPRGAGSVGPEPGKDVPGTDAVRFVAVLAMLVGVGLVAAKLGPPVAALLAPASAFFVVPFSLTFDPYYAPTERRYTDGMFSLGWIVAVAVAGLVAGAPTWLSPRVGAWVTIPALLVLALTTLFMVGGH